MGSTDDGSVNESVSGDSSGVAELLISDAQRLRWIEVGDLIQRRTPELFAQMLAAMEATAAELACVPEYIDTAYKI